jgi:hypothetical protein
LHELRRNLQYAAGSDKAPAVAAVVPGLWLTSEGLTQRIRAPAGASSETVARRSNHAATKRSSRCGARSDLRTNIGCRPSRPRSHTESNVNNPSENLEVWRAGQVRALCVFDKERISYKTKVTETQSWNDIPTCKEEGLDVQYLMLRAMFLPGKVTAEQQAFYVDLFQKVTQTPEYKDYMEKQALKPIFLTGKDMVQFLEEDDKLNTSLMNEAGFVAK